MNDVKKLYDELTDKMPDVAREVVDNGYTCDLQDAIDECADSNVDIYTSYLFEWGKRHFEYVDQALQEFGSCDSIIKVLQQGQYLQLREEAEEYLDDIKLAICYDALLNEDITSLTDDQLFAVQAVADESDRYGDIGSIREEAVKAAKPDDDDEE